MNSSANRPRKNRSSSARGGRGKPLERQMSTDGVYGNHRFMHTFGTLIGLTFQVQTKTNKKYEGIFSTFSSTFDLVLEMAHPVSNSGTNEESIKNKIFPASDIVSIKVVDVDIGYATQDSTFATDSQIGSRHNGQPVKTEKELEPWEGDGPQEEVLITDGSANGWTPNEMFRENQEKFNVKSTYDSEMSGYTTPLTVSNTQEGKEKEAEAQRLADLINSSPTSRYHAQLENGEEEESRFPGVARPDSHGNSGSVKYIHPHKRKPQGGSGGRPSNVRGTPSPQGTNRYGSHTVTSQSYHSTNKISSGHSQNMSSQAPSGGAGYSSHSYASVNRRNSQGHYSHSHEGKINGDGKVLEQPRSPEDNMSDSSRESGYHSAGKQDAHPTTPITEQAPVHMTGPVTTTHLQQPPPQPQNLIQHSQDHRRIPESKERDTRKPHRNIKEKEKQFADLEKFHNEFKLESSNKKITHSSSHSAQVLPTASPSTHPPPKHITQHPPVPPQQKSPQLSVQQQPTLQQQTVISSTQPAASSGTTTTTATSVSTTTVVSSQTTSPVVDSGKSQEELDKMATIANSKLNPDAEEFVFNPTKRYDVRSPSTQTPSRPHTPQTPHTAPGQPPPIQNHSMAFPQGGILPSGYFLSPQPPFSVQQHRFKNSRVTLGNSHRPEYTAQMQVAAATGPPILASAAPAMQGVPLAPSMMSQAQHFQYPFMVRMPPMMNTNLMSAGMYAQVGEAQQPTQQPNHHAMYMSPVLQPQQGHQVAAPNHVPGSQGQLPNHQNHTGPSGGGPVPPMPAQPPTPGPTPPQPTVLYGPPGHMGAQPPFPQHMPQHSPHTAQSAHSHQYPNPNMQPFFMVPQSNIPPHVMHAAGVPPHSSTGHIPSSVAGYTSTSSAVPHMPTQIHYITGPPGNPGHPMPVVHPSQ